MDGMDSQTFKIFVTGAGMVGWGGSSELSRFPNS